MTDNGSILIIGVADHVGALGRTGAELLLQQGKAVRAMVRNERDKGNMAIVGRTFAVADLKHVRFSGLTAWLLWSGIHIYFLIGFANRQLVTPQWAISFVTKRRGVRILPLAQAKNDSCRSEPSDSQVLGRRLRNISNDHLKRISRYSTTKKGPTNVGNFTQ